MPRKPEKRDGIIRAALELFVEKGVEATTTREIALRAGAAEGTMYRHFSGKEDLAEALFYRHLARFMDALRTAVEPHTGLPERLEAMIRTCYEFYEDDPTLFAYLLLAEHNFIRHAPPGVDTPVSLLVDVLSTAREQGTILDQPVELSAALVFGSVLRVALFRVYGRIEDDLRNLVRPVTRGCLRSVDWKEAA